MIHTTKIYLVTNCYGDSNKVYIGKTKNCRKNSHQQTYGKSITYDYIDEINSLDKKDWEPLETYWIQQFITWGFNVMNIKRSGGSGPSYLSIESRNKIRDKKIGVKYQSSKRGAEHGGTGKSRSNGPAIKNHKTRGKSISISNQTHYELNSERNKKISEKLKGQNKPERWFKSRYKPIQQFDLEGNFIKDWGSCIEASRTLNISRGNITQCCKNKVKSHKGFIWRYK
jgi:hypothetical protein